MSEGKKKGSGKGTPTTGNLNTNATTQQEEQNMSNPANPTSTTPTEVKPAPRRGRPAKAQTLTADANPAPKRQYTRKTGGITKAALKNMGPDERLKIPATALTSEFEKLTAQKEEITARLDEIRSTVALAMDENEVTDIRIKSDTGTTFEVTRRNKVRTNLDKVAMTKDLGEELIQKYTKKTPFTETRFEPVRERAPRTKKA